MNSSSVFHLNFQTLSRLKKRTQQAVPRGRHDLSILVGASLQPLCVTKIKKRGSDILVHMDNKLYLCLKHCTELHADRAISLEQGDALDRQVLTQHHSCSSNSSRHNADGLGAKPTTTFPAISRRRSHAGLSSSPRHISRARQLCCIWPWGDCGCCHVCCVS